MSRRYRHHPEPFRFVRGRPHHSVRGRRPRTPIWPIWLILGVRAPAPTTAILGPLSGSVHRPVLRWSTANILHVFSFTRTAFTRLLGCSQLTCRPSIFIPYPQAPVFVGVNRSVEGVNVSTSALWDFSLETVASGRTRGRPNPSRGALTAVNGAPALYAIGDHSTEYQNTRKQALPLSTLLKQGQECLSHHPQLTH